MHIVYVNSVLNVDRFAYMCMCTAVYVECMYVCICVYMCALLQACMCEQMCTYVYVECMYVCIVDYMYEVAYDLHSNV
jgi:hypothetical protein